MPEKEKIQAFLSDYKFQITREAESLMTLTMPELTEELFVQFERTGNRSRYETVYFARRKFLMVFGMKALLEQEENQKVSGGTIGKLSAVIADICREECWAVPAHLSRENPDWRITIDLFAAETAQTLSELADRLKGEISRELQEQIRRNVENRVLIPFLSSDHYGWEKSDHNWNAVCTGSIGSACIHLWGRGERTDACLRRICDSLLYYVEGFADDGTCMEGCGYFTYGMTYFVNFAQELYAYSQGKTDLLNGDWGHFRKGQKDKRSQIASFQSKCFFPDGTVVNFSDGNSHDKFCLGLNLALKGRFPEVSIPDISAAADLLHDHCYRFAARKLDLLETKKYLGRINDCNSDTALRSKHSGVHILPDAQWCIASAENGAAMACKGGHNGEPHNHNDVGHFIYGGNGTAFLADLGAGEYTRDYFGQKRYEILCTNSFGHSVPILNAQGQKAGEKYRCGRFETARTAASFVVEMDISPAYGEKPESVCRRLEFFLNSGDLAVTDTFFFPDQENTVVTENLVTQIRPTIEKNTILLSQGPGTASAAILGVRSDSVRVREYDHSNHQGNPETVFAIQWEVPVSDHRGECRFLLTRKDEQPD